MRQSPVELITVEIKQIFLSFPKAERTPSPHDMNRQECRTKRTNSVCGVTYGTPMRERRISD